MPTRSVVQKEKETTYIKESKRDLFVMNLDHSQLNSRVSMWRGGNSLQAKNIIVFWLKNTKDLRSIKTQVNP